MAPSFGKAFVAVIWTLCAFVPQLRADETKPPENHDLRYTDAIVLGAVEGVTEYLPVSSTGHLIIAQRALGLGEDVPQTAEASGKSTSASAVDAYCIVIQLGAIAAVAILYWRDLLSMLMGLCGRDKAGFRLGVNLMLAFLPAAVAGLLFNDWIESKLFGAAPVALALALGAPLMLGVEKWRRRKTAALESSGKTDIELHEITPAKALFVGLMQCVAMWPGTSRSMMTITGGYLIGLSPAQSARFSFLLGLITLTAATGFTLVKHGGEMVGALDAGPALAGIAVAAVTAALSVRWLVDFLSRRGLAPFAYYRIIAAILIVTIIYA